ncbi:MAG: efflux RND transporter periplasmic adaptor subunit [Glaciecola sp.]
MTHLRTITLTIVALAALSACGEQQVTQQNLTAPSVEVAPVAVANLADWHEFTGITQAPQSIELRPRVSGYIEQVHFTEGSTVEQNDVLFSIDSAPFVAEVNRLKADLASANSQYKLAKKEFARATKLSAQRAVSIGQLDEREANVEQSKARVDAVNAALDLANLQLSYTQVKAPISGKVSHAYITRGNLVTAGQSVLTNLVSTNELYTYFDANQTTLLEYKAANANAQAMPVLMSVQNDQYNISGVIDFVDNRINTQTGTIRARAVVSNENDMLVPGLFSRLRVFGSVKENAILIQDAAIGTDLSNKYVLVVNDNSVAEYRAVMLGEKVQGLRIITSGLLPGDNIVVNGLQRIQPGTAVQTNMVEMASPSSMAAIKQTQNNIARIQKLHNDSIAAKRSQSVPLVSIGH